MIGWLTSLRVVGPAFLAVAFVVGMISATLWANANHRWDNHLSAARISGGTLFDAINSDVDLPNGIQMVRISAPSQSLAQDGLFERLTDVPRPPFVTHMTVNTNETNVISGTSLRLAIVSSSLRYPVSELDLSLTHTAKETLGAVTALMATYCSDAVLFARMTGEDWQRFEGQQVWGCGAAPRDTRLAAVALGLIALIILTSVAANTSALFTGFADQLRSQRRLGGADSFPAKGPSELRDLIEAVNEYRALERKHLGERALVLSGVSHDLGTPATRLKLRTELIEDPELRGKFEGDIDQMTGIIESVLTYTRAELSTETPRQLSLTSLIDAVVADYEDTGRPVVLGGSTKVIVQGGQSIFMSRRGHAEMNDEIPVVLQARPIALQRALSNLIDNALKYGRRAVVSLETDSDFAYVLIEDEGGQDAILHLEKMTAPFQRGANTGTIEGFGMGLTIASTIAIEHGGDLTFETGKQGIVARFSIARL